MRLIRRATLAALLIALLGASLASPRSGQAAALPLYTVDAVVQYSSGAVVVRETLAFTNQSSQTLETVVFSVTPAHYGAFQLSRATVNAQEVEAALDGSILELHLPQAMPPGASVVAALDFRLQVPRRGGRFGRGPQVMALGNWLPLLAVYRDGRLLVEGQDGGWVRGQYVEIGDAFFSEAADFLVTLRADRPLTVAHTGNLVSYEETLWQFEARGVRDFALALSPSFSTTSQEVEGVELAVFYLPGHEAAASTYLRAAAEMLGWLKRTIAPYPYRHLHLAEINAQGSTTVGQEYPNLIFVGDGMAFGSSGVDSNGGVLALHEVAHQWYYSLVGNDQLYEPWLDEAMVTWLSYHFLRAKNMPSFSWIWQNRVLSPPLPNLPVNASIYDYPTEGPYLALAYRRGALFLEELYQLLGEEAFFAGLRKYTASFSGRIATPYAFLDTMQALSPANLNPLISRYFTYPRYLAPEPLRASAQYPKQEWSGAVRIALESDAPLQEVQVFVDDRPYMRALPAHVLVETGQLEEGPHLLTLRASDGQREVDLVGTFVVKHPPPLPPPTPAPPKVTAATVESLEDGASTPPTQMDTPVTTASSKTERTAAGLALLALGAAALAWGMAVDGVHYAGR